MTELNDGREEMPPHIKHDRASARTAKSWCGVDCAHEWHYHGAEHALTSIELKNGPTPCAKCLTKLRGLIDVAGPEFAE